MYTLGHRGGVAASLMQAAHLGMNTTKLIAHWTMGGEVRDVGGCFRGIDDIAAVIAGSQLTPAPTAAASSFLIKEASEDSWKTLEA